ncbi:IclR family transcriptional regulator [Paraburkholderia tropica]|uniref:IclR family transcriptional regulator n=1 Tax=Paraburkholderia tropica TaxID=92647 RepID=UPI002AB1399A|nr:IclR family transcriptional regulator [Paraburkholderia tropica]
MRDPKKKGTPVDTSDMDGGTGKQVIARAAAVLRALENQSSGLSLSRIGRASDLPRTTVHRIVTALEAQGLVTTGPSGVRLGPAIVRLAASAHTDVVAVAKPFAEALSRRTRETVDICVLREAHAISVDQFSSDQELRVVSPTGTAFPVHCTAHGKVLLSLCSDDEVDEFFEEPLQARTPSTITRKAVLFKQLAQIRATGYAIDRQEHAMGVCGVGVTLETSLPEQYAMALAVPALRFDERFESLLAALQQAKSEIEAAFGGARRKA